MFALQTTRKTVRLIDSLVLFSTTSLASFHKRCRAPIFSLMATRNAHTRCSCPTSSTASQPTSAGYAEERSRLVLDVLADEGQYPPDNKDKEAKLGEFFQTKAAPPKTLERIPKVLKEIGSQRSSISEWGVVGYCTIPHLPSSLCAHY